MEQYTTQEQAYILVDFGFDPIQPNIEIAEDGSTYTPEGIRGYSIGELIDMLPHIIINNNDDYYLTISNDSIEWIVSYDTYDKDGNTCSMKYACSEPELVDALFRIVVKLKTEDIL